MVNEHPDAIPARELRAGSGAMCFDTAEKIVCHANVNRSIWFAREDVDPVSVHCAACPIESPQFAAPWVIGTSPTMTTAGAVQLRRRLRPACCPSAYPSESDVRNISSLLEQARGSSIHGIGPASMTAFREPEQERIGLLWPVEVLYHLVPLMLTVA